MKNEIGRVWSLLFNSEEEEQIIALLNKNRLPPDRNGLKMYILGKLDNPGSPDLTPEMQALIQKAMSMAGGYIKKRAGL